MHFLGAEVILATLTAIAATAFPVVGLHLGAPSEAGIPQLDHFIRADLPKLGVNTLILEVDYNYQFKGHPECAAPGALSLADARRIAAACKTAYVNLIPEIDLLGHQSWAADTGMLLKAHPEFDETPGKFPGNKGLYCRSYCPLAPGVHKVVFSLMDDLAYAFESKAVHVGMDEVMTLADPDCPRCHEKSTASLFAGEVNRLHEHLASKGLQMWMWGDRLIDGKASGIGDWEASGNGTQAAIESIPKDIVICDWHYDNAEPTAAYFASQGFGVVTCCWQKNSVAREEVTLQNAIHTEANDVLASKAMGMMETVWCDTGDFINAMNGKAGASKEAVASAGCFRAMCAAVKKAVSP